MTPTHGRGGAHHPVLHSSTCAALTVLSGVLHLAMIGAHHPWWSTVIIVVMTVACLLCVPHIWHARSVAALRHLMGMALGMVALHTLLLLMGGGQGHAHNSALPHGMPTDGPPVPMLAVIAVELLTAFTASTLIARLRIHEAVGASSAGNADTAPGPGPAPVHPMG